MPCRSKMNRCRKPKPVFGLRLFLNLLCTRWLDSMKLNFPAPKRCPVTLITLPASEPIGKTDVLHTVFEALTWNLDNIHRFKYNDDQSKYSDSAACDLDYCSTYMSNQAFLRSLVYLL